MCGFGCIRWLKCGDGMYLFTVGSVLVVTQRMGAYWKVMCGMCHVCNVYDCVFVRFQPGSLKPTRMWPRWVSSKPRCASSRRGSPCLSLESLISLPSKFYHSHKKKSLINCWCFYPYIFYALTVTNGSIWATHFHFKVNCLLCRFHGGKREELIGITYNRLIRMDASTGDAIKTWRFSNMKQWNVNWEIKMVGSPHISTILM